MKYKCFCCGYYTFMENIIYSHDICDVCYWENDGLQNKNPTYSGGANGISLNKARENFKLFGACEKSYLKDVRPPLEDELEGLDNWID